MSGNVELSKLSGSEKQIAWAEEIRATVLRIMDAALSEVESLPDENPYKAQNRDFIESRKRALLSTEYAGDIITCFKSIYYTGDVNEDFKWLLSAYKITVPNTPGEAKLLKKELKK